MEQQAWPTSQHGQTKSVPRLDSTGHVNARMDDSLCVTVTAPANHAFEKTHRLVELSPTSLKLVSDEPLPLRELIAVELPHHLLLADVKQCVAHGNVFTSDAARIVTLPKSGELAVASKNERIDALLADMHLQCQVQLATLEASMSSLTARIGMDSRFGPDGFSEQIPGVPGNPRSASVVVEYSALDSVGSFSAGQSAIPSGAITAASEPPESDSNLADQEDATFAQHMKILGAVPPRRRGRRWFIPLALVATLSIMAWAIPLLKPAKKAAPVVAAAEPDQSSESLSEMTTTQSAPDLTAQPAVLIPDPHQSAGSAPIAREARDSIREAHTSPNILRASITATSPSWVAVCSDGEGRFQKMFAPGETREIEFSDMALVRVGYGPAVDITLNGKPIPLPELPGVVRALELSPAGARFVNYRDNSRACTPN